MGGAAFSVIDRNLFLSADRQTFDGRRAVPSESVTRLMLELADLQPGEKVLEIGTGSGYQTACLIEAVGDGFCVMSLDCESSYDVHNKGSVFLRNGMVCAGVQSDGKLGCPFYAFAKSKELEPVPYDCIFVSCGMTSIPPAYEEQLGEGGRLVIPLGKPEGQELLRLEKRNGKLVMGRCAGYVRFQMCQ